MVTKYDKTKVFSLYDDIIAELMYRFISQETEYSIYEKFYIENPLKDLSIAEYIINYRISVFSHWLKEKYNVLLLEQS